jgi:hypothetical protein
MNYSTYRFTLDIHKTKSQVSIPVLFQDTGTQLFVTLTDGGKPYKIAEGTKVVLYGKKPVFHVDTGKYDTLLEDCEVIDDGTKIKYTFSDQTTTQIGSVACEFRLYSTSGLTLTTPAFEILVNERVIEDGEIIESADERAALDSLFEREQANATAIENHEERIVTVEGCSAWNAYYISENELKSLSPSTPTTIPKEIKKAKEFATSEAFKALSDAKTYADEKVSEAVSAAAEDANEYTDEKVKALEDGKIAEMSTAISKNTDDINTNKRALELLDEFRVVTGYRLEDVECLLGDTLHLNMSSEEQTVNGDVRINGRLRVDGDQTIVEAESLLVKDRFIVCNFGDFSQGQDGKPETAGIVMLTGGRDTRDYYYHYFNAYGIIHDQSTDTVRLGRGVLRCDNSDLVDGYPEKMENPIFFFGRAEYKEGSMTVIHEEGQAISTRANNIANGNIPQWDDTQKMFVDSETSLNTFTPNTVAQKERYLYIGKDISDGKSGVVIPTGGKDHGADNVMEDGYAIVFDHNTRTLRLGAGRITHSKNIYTDEGEIDYKQFDFGYSDFSGWWEDEAIATRADSFEDGNIPIWQSRTNMFVDSGVSLGDIEAALTSINVALDNIIAIQNSLIGGNG